MGKMTLQESFEGIIDKITEKKADYLISLKGNQKATYDEVKEVFEHSFDQKHCEYYKIRHVQYDNEIGLRKD